MKVISSKVILVLILILSPFVNAQSTSPSEEIGVQNGDTFEYVLTHYVGFDPESPIFSYGTDEKMFLEVGDTFFVTVVDDSISVGNFIDLELWNAESNVTYENSLDIFDFVIFKDWEYWIDLIEEFEGGAHYQNDEIIQFSFILEDEEENLFFYFEYVYLKSSGVATHQYAYIAENDNRNQPVAFRQINMGSSYVPRPNYSAVGYTTGGLYTYEVLQVQGYGSEPILFGIDGNLTLNTGDKFLVSPLTDIVNSVNTIPISIQGVTASIFYENRLDIVNSINFPAFFLFADWDYIEGSIKSLKDFTPDEITISYEFTSNEFVYNQDFTTPNSYYSFELNYDLESGSLLYLSYIFENTVESNLKILEFKQSATTLVDKSLLKFDMESSYNYVVIDYSPISFEDAFFTTESDQLFLFADDEFSAAPLESPDSNNVHPVRISADPGQITLLSRLDVFGSFFVFADWDYWASIIDIVNDFAGEGLTVSYEQNETLFTFYRTINGIDFQSEEIISYNVENGVLDYYYYEFAGVTSDGTDVEIIINFELTGISNPNSNEDDSPS
ncbi:MAG: hypothetical protein ACW99Q_09410, partial [Candidatus Kariarchaeaceae archaeon]